MCLAFYVNYVGSFFLSLSWHLKNEETVVRQNYSINLLPSWWVLDQSDTHIFLHRVAILGESDFATVAIFNNIFSQKDIESLGSSIEEYGDEFFRNLPVFSIQVGGEDALVAEYYQAKTESDEKKLFWILTIPKRKFMVHIRDLERKDIDLLRKEIFNRITFKGFY